MSLRAQTLSQAQEREQQRAERGIITLGDTFVAKGQWMVGATGSYSTHINDNYSLVVVDNIESVGYDFDIATHFTYAFADNNAVGARIGYDRTLLRVDNSDLSFGDGDSAINLTMDDCYMLSHSYSVMAILRQYIPLGTNKRFALFNEIQLEGGGSQAKYTYDSPVQGTYSTSKSFALNFSPGITAFFTNRSAIEINVGAMGFSYSKSKELHNQVDSGTTSSNMFSFKINVLSINFGLAYYL